MVPVTGIFAFSGFITALKISIYLIFNVSIANTFSRLVDESDKNFLSKNTDLVFSAINDLVAAMRSCLDICLALAYILQTFPLCR